jgi:hypothetical protein
MSDEELAYDALCARLPTEISEQLAAVDAGVQGDRPPLRLANWCLADMPDGDFPRVYAFSTLRGLISAIEKREGTDTAVWPFYGFPLRLTRPTADRRGVKKRYLQLDPHVCVPVSSLDLTPVRGLDIESIGIEEEGWMGDPFMRRSDFFHEKFTADSAEDSPSDPDGDDITDNEDDIDETEQ